MPLTYLGETPLGGLVPLDPDLDTIGDLAPSNDDVIQRKAGAWANRTIAQLLTDLAAAGTTFQPLQADLTDLVARWVAASASGSASLAFPEDTDNGSNTATVTAPAALGGDRTLTLPDSTGTIATTAYADAKVAEAITNGVTGIAPSEDVVFDALALKAPLASPTFTGTVTLPSDQALAGNPTTTTQAAANNSTRVATTAYADALIPTAVFVPAAAFIAVTGSPVLGDAGTDLGGFLLDAAGTESVATAAMIPTGWATYDIQIVWTNAGAGSGNVVWITSYRLSFGTGEAANINVSGSNTTVAAPVQDTATFSTLVSGIAASSAGELASIRISRVGGNASDTLANDAALIGVRLVRAS